MPTFKLNGATRVGGAVLLSYDSLGTSTITSISYQWGPTQSQIESKFGFASGPGFVANIPPVTLGKFVNAYVTLDGGSLTAITECIGPVGGGQPRRLTRVITTPPEDLEADVDEAT
jgi:hypothetical protein